MKGIILAGGSGIRLYPIARGISKQLIPVYDKPMTYYPLSTLMLAGIRDVLVISTPEYMPLFQDLLEDGSNLGLNFSYRVQEEPNGFAEAFILGEDFIGDDSVCLILGDNIYYGTGLSDLVQSAAKKTDGATTFGYHIGDSECFGVVDFDDQMHALSIEEKPAHPKSGYAVTGLYFYGNQIVDIAKNIKPSDRGEPEITDVNKEYLRQDKPDVKLMRYGYAWLDTGIHDSTFETVNFIATIEKRQNLKVASLEEIAHRMGYINKEQSVELAQPLKKNGHGQYSLRLVRQDQE